MLRNFLAVPLDSLSFQLLFLRDYKRDFQRLVNTLE
jgi:hypothetical protein